MSASVKDLEKKLCWLENEKRILERTNEELTGRYGEPKTVVKNCEEVGQNQCLSSCMNVDVYLQGYWKVVFESCAWAGLFQQEPVTKLHMKVRAMFLEWYWHSWRRWRGSPLPVLAFRSWYLQAVTYVLRYDASRTSLGALFNVPWSLRGLERKERKKSSWSRYPVRECEK